MFWNKKKKQQKAEDYARLEEYVKEFKKCLFNRYTLNNNINVINSEMSECYYADKDNKIKFKENEDYETTDIGYKHLIIFYDKEIKPYHWRKNDRANKYFVLPVDGKLIIIKKIRQQRTHGSLDGGSSFSFHHSAGFGGGSANANGGGSIKGSLDTDDEFILVIKFNKKNYEVRVSANLFYDVEEGEERFASKPYWSYSIEDKKPEFKIEYNQEEVVNAESNKFNIKDLEVKMEANEEEIKKFEKILPAKAVREAYDYVNWHLNPDWRQN